MLDFFVDCYLVAFSHFSKSNQAKLGLKFN